MDVTPNREFRQKFHFLEFRYHSSPVSQSEVMQITLASTPLEQTPADALIVLVFEGRKESRFSAAALVESGEVAGKPLEQTLLHHVPGVAATRILLAGAGKPERFDPAELRKLTGAAVRFLKSKSVKKIAIALEDEQTGPDFVSAAVEGALLGDFEPDRHKTGDDKKSVDSFTVVAPASANLDAAIARGRIIGESTNFARDMINEPGN